MRHDEPSDPRTINYGRSDEQRLATPAFFAVLVFVVTVLHLAAYLLLAFAAYLSMGEGGVTRPDGAGVRSAARFLALPLLRLAWRAGVDTSAGIGFALLVFNSLAWGLAAGSLGTLLRWWRQRSAAR